MDMQPSCSNSLLILPVQTFMSVYIFILSCLHGRRKFSCNCFCLPFFEKQIAPIILYLINFNSVCLQSYTTNSAKVIFLNHRPQTRIVNIRGNNCSTCDRGLQYPYLFCSISCKVDHILTTKGVAGLSSFFCDCKFLPLPEPGSDDGLMTPDSVLEPSGSTKTSSSSGGYGGVDCRTLACTATTEIVRKKRSSLTSSCRTMYPRITEISSNLMSRRKKAPSRAPLY
ncbi:PLATZ TRANSCRIPTION FACTOR FAMILY PROTEIN [Salix viminalis]|uniref:PLATZ TRANSCRIPTION FACTOR FAMILY PROTEIN n=1 Tax=Salix viminalis TaxID=40686 RepID=A0A9Q0SFW7_SALVM|nr:PLATZ TRANSCRIPTION FACTOR FAMILY PROTEIN [Salix viminalis]